MYTVRNLRLAVAVIQKPDAKEGMIFYNKYKFKQFLEDNNVRTPKTYMFIQPTDAGIPNIDNLDKFILKPNLASSGIDVYNLTKQEDGSYREIDGRTHPIAFVYGKIDNIIHIDGSGGVLIEETIENPLEFDIFKNGSPGICDLRLYMLDDEILFGKFRVPTLRSGGYANTSRKACAFFVDKNGIIQEDDIFNNTNVVHPDTEQLFKWMKIPYWKEMSETAIYIAKLFKVRFHSVDITIDLNGNACCCECELIPYLGQFTSQGCMIMINKINHALDKVA